MSQVSTRPAPVKPWAPMAAKGAGTIALCRGEPGFPTPSPGAVAALFAAKAAS